MKRNDKLINKKFYSYLLPGIMMVAAMQLGNLVDSIFVGNLLGTNALSAINLGMPVVFLSQIPIIILAVGGSIVAAINLGKRDLQKASDIFTCTMFIVLVFNILNAAASLFYCKGLAMKLAMNGSLADMAYKFMLVYLLGMPVMGIGLMLSYYLSIDNHPSESAVLHIVANVINLVTDILYIKYLDMGIIGSALSTVTGYSIAAVVFGIIYLRSDKRTLQVTPKTMFTDMSMVTESVKNGLSSGLLMILSAVKMFILNGAILSMTGEQGMALYAVCTNAFFIVQLCLHGISGVIQTIAGILYGEKDYFGIRIILKNAFRLAIIVSIVLIAVFIGTPDIIEVMFGFNMPDYKALMDMTLRVYALSFVFYAINNIVQTYYSTIEKPFYATLNTVLQGFVIIIPVTFILMKKYGIVGTSIASVIAEVGALAIVLLLVRVNQNRGRAVGKSLDMLPQGDSERFVDITVNDSVSDAAKVAHSIREFCVKERLDEKTAHIIAMSAEELVRSIACFNEKHRSYIDICLVREDDELFLRVRDDGLLFNPLEGLSEDNDDIEKMSEIQIIKKLAKNIEYSRILNMNNTVVTVDVTQE